MEEQQRELERKEPVVFYSDQEPENVMAQALAGALQEVLEGDEEELLIEDQEGSGEEANDELTSFQRQLLAIMGDDLEERIIKRKREKKGPRRFAVFMGRCPRCKGFMINIPERYNDIRDDDVYRCFTCGYRTSPGYQWNRQQGT